jgi:hypothetical protein
MAGARERVAQLDDSANVPIKRMFSVSLVKAMKTIRPGGDESERAELAQFVLDGVKGEVSFQH